MQVAGALLRHGPNPWAYGWAFEGSKTDSAASASLADAFACVPDPPTGAAHSHRSTVPHGAPGRVATKEHCKHGLAVGQRIAVCGSPFGCLHPRVFGASVRLGYVSNHVPGAVDDSAIRRQRGCSPNAKLLDKLVSIDVAALPGAHSLSMPVSVCQTLCVH